MGFQYGGTSIAKAKGLIEDMLCLFYDMLQCQEMVSGGALFGLIWAGMFLFFVCIL